MSHVHLCIITGQPLANLIPLLQEKPEHIVLMCTDDKQSDAEAFQKTLEKAGFKSEQVHLKAGLPLYPFEAIQEYMIELYDDLDQQLPDTRLTWNATGGTKQMALAIWDVLDRKTDRVIYCDTRSGHLEELIPESGSVTLESQLSPELYLHALGKIKRSAESDRSQWCERAQARKKATRHLGDNVEALAGLIQLFNRQLDSDGSGSQCVSIDKLGSQWRNALQLLEQAGVLDDAGDGRFNLISAESVRYLTGGWLEEYVWHSAKDSAVDHVEIGLKFGDLAHRKQGQDNEIDAFIVNNNRLLLIECKSGYMGRDGRKDGDIIYKLDSIGLHAGGTQAARLLVSAQALQHETKAGRKVDTKARASATGIYTLEAGELKTLRTRIEAWKAGGTW